MANTMKLRKVVREYELEPKYVDTRCSFYKKAYVVETNDSYILRSYSTEVCSIDKKTGKVDVPYCDDYVLSNTTMRHLREFLEKFNKEWGSKKQICEMYCKEYQDRLKAEKKEKEDAKKKRAAERAKIKAAKLALKKKEKERLDKETSKIAKELNVTLKGAFNKTEIKQLAKKEAISILASC